MEVRRYKPYIVALFAQFVIFATCRTLLESYPSLTANLDPNINWPISISWGLLSLCPLTLATIHKNYKALLATTGATVCYILGFWLHYSQGQFVGYQVFIASFVYLMFATSCVFLDQYKTAIIALVTAALGAAVGIIIGSRINTGEDYAVRLILNLMHWSILISLTTQRIVQREPQIKTRAKIEQCDKYRQAA